MRTRAFAVLAMGFGMAATPSSAVVFGGSNLDLMGYPKASCRKPPVPYGTSKFDAEQYDYDVDRYIRCVNTYIDNANNDIERIAEAVKDLKREAERRY